MYFILLQLCYQDFQWVFSVVQKRTWYTLLLHVCAFSMKEKKWFVTVLWDWFFWMVQTHTQRRTLKMSQNLHDFTNNLPSMHSRKMYHTNFKYTSHQATSYMPTFSSLIFQDTVRFPPEALLMCRVWLCFPSLSTSWSHWGFGTCNRGSQPSLWEVLLTRRPRRAEQLCRVSMTTVLEPHERNTSSWKQT